MVRLLARFVGVSQRIQLANALPQAYRDILALHTTVEKAAADAGLDPRLIELVKIRASQLNGCAFCLDIHTRIARQEGETDRRLAVLAGWRDAEGVFDERERAALALTDALTRIGPEGVPEEVRLDVEAVFSDAEIAALVFTIAAINAWNRMGIGQALPLRGED